MSKRHVVDSPERIEEIDRQIREVLRGDRITSATLDGYTPCIIIDEGKRPRSVADVNWRALKADRPLPTDTEVYLVRRGSVFVVYPALDSDWQDAVEERVQQEGSARCLRDALAVTHNRERCLAEMAERAEEALLSGAWHEVDWSALFQARAEFKACDLDKMVPTGSIEALLDSVAWPLAGLSMVEATSLLHFPRANESELTAMKFDDITAGATAAAASTQATEAATMAILYKKELVSRADPDYRLTGDSYTPASFYSCYGNAELAMQDNLADRMRGLDRRTQRQALVAALATAVKSSMIEEDVRTLLDFPGDAADFNERNNHWNRRFLGAINRVSHLLDMDATQIDSAFLEDAARNERKSCR